MILEKFQSFPALVLPVELLELILVILLSETVESSNTLTKFSKMSDPKCIDSGVSETFDLSLDESMNRCFSYQDCILFQKQIDTFYHVTF